MEITGKVIWVGSIESGVSKSGSNWSKQAFQVEYSQGQYPNSVVFETFDESCLGNLAVGQLVTVKFDFAVREWNEKKFNDIRVWRNGVQIQQPYQQQGQYYQQPQQPYQQPYQQPQPQQGRFQQPPYPQQGQFYQQPQPPYQQQGQQSAQTDQLPF